MTMKAGGGVHVLICVSAMSGVCAWVREKGSEVTTWLKQEF